MTARPRREPPEPLGVPSAGACPTPGRIGGPRRGSTPGTRGRARGRSLDDRGRRPSTAAASRYASCYSTPADCPTAPTPSDGITARAPLVTLSNPPWVFRTVQVEADAHSIGTRQDRPVVNRDSQLLRIRTDNGADELRSLLAWLQGDDALRGRVRLEHAPIGSDEMGGLVDALTVALGSGGIGAALASSLTTWISQRRSDVKFTVTTRNGQSIEVDAKRVDAQALTREIERIVRTEEGA
ncbi:hypothetical protein AB0C96_26825 [Streptomyces sp. NPDC048506]|uniref:effector-associated constant component EACC1 n=1 Tax=Streptomyces sp. NPDC048506 TaxID=3155028 RepID=UPI003429F219